MSRYTAQILFYVGIVIIIWIAAAITSAVIWRITLRHGGNFPRIRRIHIWLAVLTPTALIAFNLISCNISEPHTTLLWAYFITPLATALPFLASLAGLCGTKHQRTGEHGCQPPIIISISIHSHRNDAVTSHLTLCAEPSKALLIR